MGGTLSKGLGSWTTVALVVISAGGVTGSARLLYSFYSRNSKPAASVPVAGEQSNPAPAPPSKPSELWNTALFFPSYFPDEPGSSFSRLLGYIGSAERSLKVCVMTITYAPLLRAIMEKAREGVKVKVFTSYLSAYGGPDQPGKAGSWLRGAGVPIRSMPKSDYSTEMHNKYAIIDDEAVLTGSLNWTVVSVTQQRENILITTDRRIVPKYVQHFEQLWAGNDWNSNTKRSR